jgi:hypothetical protein
MTFSFPVERELEKLICFFKSSNFMLQTMNDLKLGATARALCTVPQEGSASVDSHTAIRAAILGLQAVPQGWSL